MATNTFSYPLYDYAVGWFNRQAANPLEFIAPAQAVPGVTGTYKRYPQGYAFREIDTRRACMAPAHAVDILAEDVPYLLEDHSLRIGVDDSDLKPGAGSAKEAADQIAQSRINSLLATWRTSQIVGGLAYFRSQVAADATAGNWSAAAAEPVSELLALLEKYEATNGVLPNRILMSRSAWNILAENASILDRVVYNDAQALTPELLLKLLRLDPAKVRLLVDSIPMASAKPGPGMPFEGANALGADMWFTYVDEGQLIGNMTGMRTLHAGDASPVETVESYYERATHTTWYEVNMHRAFAVTAPSCNIRINVR